MIGSILVDIYGDYVKSLEPLPFDVSDETEYYEIFSAIDGVNVKDKWERIAVPITTLYYPRGNKRRVLVFESVKQHSLVMRYLESNGRS